MPTKVTIKNYRGFTDRSPLVLPIGRGMTSYVGVNNSGKSTILRLFYELRPLFQQMRNPGVLNSMLRGQPISISNGLPVEDTDSIFSSHNDRPIELIFHCSPPDHDYVNVTDDLSLQGPFVGTIQLTITRPFGVIMMKIISPHGSLRLERCDLSFPRLTLNFGKEAYFSDFTEVMKSIDLLCNTMYIGPFRSAIDVDPKGDYFDLSVGRSFISKWKTLKTGPNKRNNEKAYNLTRDIGTIFNLENLEINASEGDHSLQLFIGGRSFMLHELGAGISQFIVVLANAAIRQPAIILIDEPELNLHPSLQLDFLTTLSSQASVGTAFATHSMGLARSGSERIYIVRKQNDGSSQVVPMEAVPRKAELLGELSFSSYRELGFERILFVEGRTDVKTYQQLLRMYGKDHTIVIMSLGGKDMIGEASEDELLEVLRISKRVSVVIDSELSAEGDTLDPKRKAFVEMCGRIGIDCHVLKWRATENYLTDAAVKSVRGPQARALGAYEKLGDTAQRWPKSENWRIAREMTRADVDPTDLGTFLDSL